MSRRPICVEFLGLPGSGKSALARRAAELLLSRGLTVDEPSYHLAHRGRWISKQVRKTVRVAAECLLHPIDSLAAGRVIGSVRHPSFRVRVKMTFNWLLVSRLARRARSRGGIHLLDQGMLQGIWSIGFGSGEEAVRRVGEVLTRRLPPADLVALVEAAPDTVRRRLASRPEMDSRMDRIDSDRPGLMEHCGRVLEATRRLAEGGASRMDGVIPVRNETEEDLRRGAEGIVARVLALRAAGGGAP